MSQPQPTTKRITITITYYTDKTNSETIFKQVQNALTPGESAIVGSVTER
ncbi:MAG: hypothetical protein WC365_09135 [Candidatus Babeliales bacterium]